MLPFICSFQRVGTGQCVPSAAVVSQHKFASSREPPPSYLGCNEIFFLSFVAVGTNAL